MSPNEAKPLADTNTLRNDRNNELPRKELLKKVL